MDELKSLDPSISKPLEELKASPLDADLSTIWALIEPQLSSLKVEGQLKLVGDIVETLASIHHTKAELLLSEWHEAHNTEGPILNDGWLQGLARQTTYLDVSALCHRPKRDPAKASPDITFKAIDKQAALQYAEDSTDIIEIELEDRPREDITHWSLILQSVLGKTNSPLSLQALIESLQHQDLSWSEILMTLLLSRSPEFTVQGAENFYCSFEELTVSIPLNPKTT